MEPSDAVVGYIDVIAEIIGFAGFALIVFWCFVTRFTGTTVTWPVTAGSVMVLVGIGLKAWLEGLA